MTRIKTEASEESHPPDIPVQVETFVFISRTAGVRFPVDGVHPASYAREYKGGVSSG
jgi:hypothetical protein